MKSAGLQIIRSIIPPFLLNIYRGRKKAKTRHVLEKQRKSGDIFTCEKLAVQFRDLGLQTGDTVLVHCAMSKIGFLEEGPKTLVDALKEVVGLQGNVLMPTSPNASFQIEYARNHSVFDVKGSPSALGAVSEYFRQLPDVVRSAHPTEPVAAWGPDAIWLTEGHLGEQTPYTARSPFCRLYEKNGKILYIGVTLDNAGTNLHTLEDAVDFKYPVYASDWYFFTVRDAAGREHRVKTRVHHPEFSKRRKCDGLLPLFEREGVARKGIIGHAPTWIFDGPGMFRVMLEKYRESGITMYTPTGEKLPGYDL